MGEVVEVGPLRLRFASSDDGVEQRLARLYDGFPRATAGVDAQVVTVERSGADEAPGWVAAIDGTRVRWAPDLYRAEEALTRHINRLVLDAEPGTGIDDMGVALATVLEELLAPP